MVLRRGCLCDYLRNLFQNYGSGHRRPIDLRILWCGLELAHTMPSINLGRVESIGFGLSLAHPRMRFRTAEEI